MGKIGYTLEIMRSSWHVLMQDKELLLFPLFSAVCCLIVAGSFALPLYAMAGSDDGDTVAVTRSEGDSEGFTAEDAGKLAVGFAFYFCNYFVIVFFNSAIVACAVYRMKGGDPNVGLGLRAAFARLPQIFGWALVAATVGMILRGLENNKRGVGRFVVGLLGMAWTLLTFLVIPVMVVEKKGPIASFTESTRLLKKTWGEQLVGNFGFGLIFFLLFLPGIALIFGGVMAFQAHAALAVALIAVAVAWLILLSLVQTALQSIFQAALYLYAKEGVAPEGFDAGSLGGALSSAGRA